MHCRFPNKTVFSIFMVLILSLILSFSSCTSVPEKETQEETPTAEVEAAEAPETQVEETNAVVQAEEEKPEEARAVSLVLTTKETSLFPDGSLDQYRVYTYLEGTDSLVKEELFRQDGLLVEQVIYQYAEDLLLKREVQDGSGKLTGFRSFKYSEKGNLLEESLFGAKGELQSQSRYEYDDLGNKTKWSIFDSQGTLIAYSLYLYKDGEPAAIENYSPSGDLEESFQFEYSQGKRTKLSEYDSRKKLVRFTQYLYDNGILMSEEYYTGTKVLQRKVLYLRDDLGEITEIHYLDGQGNLREIIKREYNVIEIVTPAGR